MNWKEKLGLTKEAWENTKYNLKKEVVPAIPFLILYALCVYGMSGFFSLWR